MYTKYKIVPFCPYHFVCTILTNTILSVYHIVHTILSVPFCPLPFCPVTVSGSSSQPALKWTIFHCMLFQRCDIFTKTFIKCITLYHTTVVREEIQMGMKEV